MRTRGSHRFYAKAGSDIRISVQVHGSTSIKRGLQRHLMKLADIDDTELQSGSRAQSRWRGSRRTPNPSRPLMIPPAVKPFFPDRLRRASGIALPPALRRSGPGIPSPGSRFPLREQSSCAVTLFLSPLSDRLGAVRGCSRQNAAVPRRAQRRVHPLIRFDRPALAGPRDHDARFGRRHVPGGGIHLRGRCRGLRRTMVPHGHTPCPGCPDAPSGRPGVQVFRCFAALLSGLRQDGALRHQSGGGETPQRHQQLAGQRHDPPFPRRQKLRSCEWRRAFGPDHVLPWRQCHRESSAQGHVALSLHPHMAARPRHASPRLSARTFP